MLSFCRLLSSFIVGLFNLYEDLFFTYLEINPLGKFITWISPSHRPGGAIFTPQRHPDLIIYV